MMKNANENMKDHMFELRRKIRLTIEFIYTTKLVLFFPITRLSEQKEHETVSLETVPTTTMQV